MNVFVLSTGRCGSETFVRACKHITNYTAAHESLRAQWSGPDEVAYLHLDYPSNHIESDNRLSWFLGTLDKRYGDSAFYVHLIRDQDAVARSYTARGTNSILFAYAWGTLQYFKSAHGLSEETRLAIARQYWQRVNDNIELFLRDKTQQITIWLHEAETRFREFWNAIGAEGDLPASLAEWRYPYNATVQCKPSWRLDAEHYYRAHQVSIRIAEVVPAASGIVLVDDYFYYYELSLTDRHILPFRDPADLYSGPPGDDHSALEILGRLKAKGAQYLVFLAPAFWWLNHYAGFREHLETTYSCLIRDREVIIYRLIAL